MLSGEGNLISVELACLLTPSAQCVFVNFNSVAHVEVEKSLGNKLPVVANTCLG